MKITLPIRCKHVYQSQDGRIIEAWHQVTTYKAEIPDGSIKVSEAMQIKSCDMLFGVLQVAQKGSRGALSKAKQVHFFIENARTIEEAFEQFHIYAPKSMTGSDPIRP